MEFVESRFNLTKSKKLPELSAVSSVWKEQPVNHCMYAARRRKVCSCNPGKGS